MKQIRLVVEEGLNQLPYTECIVTTPTGNGNTVIKAVRVLNEHVVQPLHIILLSLFSTPHGTKWLGPLLKFPDITILTTEVHPIAPSHFGQKYFGTE
ncbi:hypothetical protein P4O66_020231 [Electrophorus voltai]|uniref:Uracil phosphoribosyltransferase homolog n=1 Tax=Electrophorus voltai TaxID=2609070 RepID=A0AAD8ZRQ2_9TELE|nr:hypothetical protein P4O66_020231 [Electrophorus voltai]